MPSSVDPRGADLKRLLAEDPGGPVVMLNLLRFAEGGRPSYEAYAREIVPHLERDTHEWDAVLLVRYPSREAFSRMVADPSYQSITHLRTEALSAAVLQATVPWAGPA